MSVFRYRWSNPEKLISVEDYRRAAMRRLPRMVWHYLEGGADDLVTIRDNIDAYSRWSFSPKALRGVGTPDLRTQVAGVDLDLPVIFAPVGFTGLAYWKGDIAAARAAERQGTRSVLSTASSWSIEEVANATRENHFFQLYPRSGEITEQLLTRARNAGYESIFLTVDVPARGNREGERKHGMGEPPVLTPAEVLNSAMHPKWVYELYRHRRVGGRNLVDGLGMKAMMRSIEVQSRELMQSTLNWDDVRWIRDKWAGRLYIKGILNAADAEQAVGLGVNGVVVSNHGGRQLDYAPATLEVLPSIAAAVGSRMEVLVDGGIRRGSDVIKALALGAKAVLVGRPSVYGMVVDAENGAARILEILAEEMSRDLTLLGIGSVSDISKDSISPRTLSTLNDFALRGVETTARQR